MEQAEEAERQVKRVEDEIRELEGDNIDLQKM